MRSLASGTGVGIRLMDFLDAARYVRRQRQLETRDIARELLEDRRADQRAGDEGAMHHIGDRHLRRIETVTAREIAIGLRRREAAAPNSPGYATAIRVSMPTTSASLFCSPKVMVPRPTALTLMSV